MKVDRKFKILSLLATADAGISFSDLCAKLGFATEKERNVTSVLLSDLGRKGWVSKPSERGGNWSITPDGRGWLTADQKFARKATRKPAQSSTAGEDLGDFPTQRRVPAVDGQAPRHLVNSPFSMAAATSKEPPPERLAKRLERVLARLVVAFGGRLPCLS